MASLDADGFSQGHSIHHHQKITKSRNRAHVKPILKKLQSGTSEKQSSLDLDRSWDEQPAQYFAASHHYQDSPSYQHTRAARDVSFSSSSAADLGLCETPGSGGRGSFDTTGAGRRRKTPVVDKYSHARSTSGASHASVATSNSGRTGTFVHPRQQMPRTSTPPLSQSYGNTFGRSSLDYNFGLGGRDFEYSTTIDEHVHDSDDIQDSVGTPTPSTTTPSALTQYSTQLSDYSASGKISSPSGNANSLMSSNAPAARPYNHHRQHSGPSGVRSPTAASRRTSSLSDVTSNQPGLRVSTKTAGTSPRIVSTVNHGRSEDSSGSPAPGSLDTPDALHNDGSFSSSSFSPASHGPSPVIAQMRSSLDMSGFRLRSRSSLDTATRQEQVRAARRKFEEKEKHKEQKYERELNRKRERADTKEAQRQLRAGSLNGLASGRGSSSLDMRPALSRRSTSDLRTYAQGGEPVVRGYEDATSGTHPEVRGTEDVQFATPPRKSRARAKTSGWTAFMLWFRTRLVKLERR